MNSAFLQNTALNIPELMFIVQSYEYEESFSNIYEFIKGPFDEFVNVFYGSDQEDLDRDREWNGFIWSGEKYTRVSPIFSIFASLIMKVENMSMFYSGEKMYMAAVKPLLRILKEIHLADADTNYLSCSDAITDRLKEVQQVRYLVELIRDRLTNDDRREYYSLFN